MEIKDRFIWAGNDHPPLRKMPSVAADHIEVHHSVTTMPYTTHADGTIRGIYKFHVGPERRWSDIFYNYLIDRQGVIWEGRDAKHRSSVGTALTVCCLADYSKDEVPNAVKVAILELNAASGYTKPLSWHAKRAFGTKYASSCPGRSMVEWLEAGYPMPSGQGSFKMNKEAATTAVQWCYTNILGREADPSGLAYWVDRVVNGLAVEDMRWQFVSVRFAMDAGSQVVGGRDKFVSDLIALAKASA